MISEQKEEENHLPWAGPKREKEKRKPRGARRGRHESLSVQFHPYVEKQSTVAGDLPL